MRLSLILLLTIFFSISYGQNCTNPSIPSTGKTIADFVPEGWAMLDSAYGDLNKDSIQDAAIILQLKDSVWLKNNVGDSALTQPRILLILFKKSVDNCYKLIEQSNSFILKHDQENMDDPYQAISIEKGVLNINFYLFYTMGSWYVSNYTYRFRYQQGQFYLIGAEYFSLHRGSLEYEKRSYNFLSKKQIITKGSDSKGTSQTSRKAINITSLKTLKSFEEPFTWEVDTDIYL